MGDMGAMMKEMMKDMGVPKQKEFYPSLMDLSELNDEERTKLETRANERMRAGALFMDKALQDLIRATEAHDLPRMREASANLREGLGQFESGVATHEGLAGGKSPEEIGLSWFRENLGLERSMPSHKNEGAIFGISFFHFFVMLILVLFSSVMLVMYFFKMRRASQLLARLSPSLEAESNSLTPAKVVRDPDQHWTGKLKVATIYQETPNVKTFRLVPPEGGDLPFTYLAGQFLTLSAVIDGKPIKRAYTIASHPCDRKMLELTIKREENGLVSRFLHDVVREGDLIDIEAAYGNLTFSGVGGAGIVLIGGGVGITPLMSVLRCLISCGMKNDIHLLYACKGLTDFVYREELRLLQERNPNLKVVVAVDKLDGSFPGAFEGRLTKEKIQKAVPDIAKYRVHLCGPPGMMKAMKDILSELKVPDDQVKTEAFGPAKTATPQATPHPVNTNVQNQKQVSFKKAGKTVGIRDNETVLELAETSGVEIPFSCRVGTCGVCKVKLSSGEVSMEVQDALTEADKSSGVILACQAKAKSDLVIEEP